MTAPLPSETTKHTPGPWRVGGEWPTIFAVYDARGIYIAHANTGIGSDWIGENPLGRRVAQANARLIAAAPEMLEALESFVAVSNDEERRLAFNQAVAAIAKARGETA